MCIYALKNNIVGSRIIIIKGVETANSKHKLKPGDRKSLPKMVRRFEDLGRFTEIRGDLSQTFPKRSNYTNKDPL